MDHRRRRKRRPSLEGRVMRAFEEAARPLLPAELLQIMQGEPDQAEAINALLEQLVNQGKLVSLKGGRIGLPEKMNLVTGDLSVHPDGFGFVTPETGGRDIYLTALNLKEAWHGDRVVVQDRRQPGQPQGRQGNPRPASAGTRRSWASCARRKIPIMWSPKTSTSSSTWSFPRSS